jgi:hypothetical protein
MPDLICFRCKQPIPEGEKPRIVDTRESLGMGKKPMHAECAIAYFQEMRRQRANGGPKIQGWNQIF